MAAELIVRPGEQCTSRADFISRCKPGTIAVEAVAAGPELIHTPDGPYLIIDHHEEVVRRVTVASCLQAWNAATLGQLEEFRDENGKYCPTLLTRDCDQDATLALYALDRFEVLPRLTDQQHDRFDELVHAESELDVFGGIPPGRITRRKLQMMGRIAWIFDAYTDYKTTGGLYLNKPRDHLKVIQHGYKRITQHINGSGRSRPLDTRYKTLGPTNRYAIIKQVGTEALLGACSDGLRAVIAWRLRPDGTHQYTYYRRSASVPFNLNYLYEVLNAAEGCPEGQGHGGSNDIGGSPLASGSTIGPDELRRIIDSDSEILSHP